MVIPDNNTPAPGDAPTNTPNPQSPAGHVTTEAHHQGIEKARGEERAKYIGQIELLNGQLTETRTKIAELERAVADEKAKIAAIENSRTEDGRAIDVPKLLETYTKKVADEYNSRIEREMGERDNRLKNLESENLKYRAENLRRSLIAEAGGEDTMVVEMVSGNTEEEIRASIALAQKAYARIAGIAPVSTPENPSSVSQTSVPPELPLNSGAAPAVTPSSAGALGDVKRMSQAEYQQHRESILRKAGEASGRQGSNPFSGTRRGSAALRGNRA